MPKINVYLSDELATAVKEAGVPVSPVCQQALATAVSQANRARRTITLIRDPGFDPAAWPQVSTGLEDKMTARLVEALGLARAAAGAGPVGTVALARGILSHAENLGVRLLRTLDVDTDDLAVALERADPSDGEPAATAAAEAPGSDGAALTGFTRSAWLAVGTAAEAAVELGHNYIGCEHIVLGLLDGADGTAGPALRAAGADPASGRKVLTSMLSGYVHGRNTTMAAGSDIMRQILARLDTLESRVASLDGASE
jgi:Clp amino terminal domain, pathogenicity island component